jgi:hypothetical protein
MLLSKEDFIAESSPMLMRGVSYPDHGTIVEHTLIRAKLLAEELSKKGLFDENKELSSKERYLLKFSADVLSSTVGPDPQTAVTSALVRCEMLANSVLQNPGANIFLAPVPSAINNSEGVKQTPTENIVQHRSW